MKFKLITTHVYPWPVTIFVPHTTNAGEVVEQKFNATFTVMPQAELEAMDASIAALTPDEQKRHKDDLLRRVFIGWDENVVGDDDKPLAFSEMTREQVLQLPWNTIGLYRAYYESHRGEANRLGN